MQSLSDPPNAESQLWVIRPVCQPYKLPIAPLGDHRGMKIAGLLLAVQWTVGGAEVGYPLVL